MELSSSLAAAQGLLCSTMDENETQGEITNTTLAGNHAKKALDRKQNEDTRWEQKQEQVAD